MNSLAALPATYVRALLHAVVPLQQVSPEQARQSVIEHWSIAPDPRGAG